MFYETIAENIAYEVLSCVIYTITKNYVFIDFLACQLKKLSEFVKSLENHYAITAVIA